MVFLGGNQLYQGHLKSLGMALKVLSKKNAQRLDLRFNHLREYKTDAELYQMMDGAHDRTEIPLVDVGHCSSPFASVSDHKIHYFLSAIEFANHLKLIQEKLVHFERNCQKDEGYQEAYKFAKTLLSRFNSAQEELKKPFDSQSNASADKIRAFKTSCLQAIKDSRTILDSHREWHPLLVKIASALVSVATLFFFNIRDGVGIFGLFPTDTSKKLDTLQQVITGDAYCSPNPL